MTLIEKYNTPCADFTEALEKGIISRDPIFEINTIKFYVFAKGLTLMAAERFLQYQENMRFWREIGMSKEVSTDYINEVIEKLEETRNSSNDSRLVSTKLDEALVTLRLYEEHKRNFNYVGAMLEACSLAIMTQNENPYTVDLEHNSEKIKIFQAAMDAPNGDEFTVFFWKLSSLPSMDWLQRLMDFTPYWAKETMTPEEMNLYKSDQDLLTFDILKTKRLLETLKFGESSLSPVKIYRSILNLVKKKSNTKVFSIISTIQNS